MRNRRVLAAACAALAGCSAPETEAIAAPGGAPPNATDFPIRPHEQITLASAILGEVRRINIYTPPGYASAPAARYPILYMPDGGLEEDFPHVTRAVDDAIAAHAMQPVIVVGIENTERRRDLTGPTDVASDREIAPRVGGSAAFRAFLRDELRIAVEARLRGSGVRGIIGESLAGEFILETLAREPGLFDVYIALSPSLWWNAQVLVREAPAWAAALPERPLRLFLATAADDDLDEAGGKLTAALTAHAPRTLTWTYVPMPAEKHSTIYRAAAPRTLRWAFPP